MNKLLFLIIFCVCNLFLYAQPHLQAAVEQAHVTKVKLCNTDKVIKDRYEMFSYEKDCIDNDYLLKVSHKDILVNSSGSNINVEITCSN